MQMETLTYNNQLGRNLVRVGDERRLGDVKD